ncbi:MAG: YHYH protein, partial [Patescibacteria group bacterium]|nr:YHYH protein [Patescibacteria group bacterium]
MVQNTQVEQVTEQPLPDNPQLRYVSNQEKAMVQHKIARMAFVSLAFLLIFSVGAGLYWYAKNKNILQQATNRASVTKVTVVTPEVGQISGQGSGSQEFMINMHALPLGDGKISTSPKIGYVYSCLQGVSTATTSQNESWIDGDSWDAGEKTTVDGSVTWPNAKFDVSMVGGLRVVRGNELPVTATTGTFPISSDDPAYQFDHNPNSIKLQALSLSLPADPQLGQPMCLPEGMIGIALNGVPIFSAIDNKGQDSVAHEMLDSCNGHPDSSGVYHYHGPSSCIPGSDKSDTLVGYALDGFGIYSHVDASGNEIKNSDL